MSAEISQYEWGKIVASIDSLSRDVIKLEAKIDVFLKDTIGRREFDDLKKHVDVLETTTETNIGRREFDNLRSDVTSLGALVKTISDEVNKNQWIPRLMWLIIGVVVAGAGSFFIH